MDMEVFKAVCREMGVHLRAVQDLMRENDLGNSISLIVHDDMLSITFQSESERLNAISIYDRPFRHYLHKENAAPDGHPEAAKQIK